MNNKLEWMWKEDDLLCLLGLFWYLLERTEEMYGNIQGNWPAGQDFNSDPLNKKQECRPFGS
jgi:hypothetical protein